MGKFIFWENITKKVTSRKVFEVISTKFEEFDDGTWEKWFAGTSTSPTTLNVLGIRNIKYVNYALI